MNEIKYKKPLSIEEQIDYLEKSKSVVYNKCSKEEARHILYKYNYINVISPFKYYFAEKDTKGNVIKDKNNCHIYNRKIDFGEYFQKYKNERNEYANLYVALSYFESVFNAIVSNEVIYAYELENKESFNSFVVSLSKNVLALQSETFESKQHMLKTISNFNNELDKYNSIFIFMDRLSISELITIYKSCGKEISNIIFKAMYSNGLTLGYTKKSDFDNCLSKLVHIRNCIMHSNSITILIRYYNVKNKSLRKSTDKKAYQNIIKNLLLISRNNRINIL